MGSPSFFVSLFINWPNIPYTDKYIQILSRYFGITLSEATSEQLYKAVAMTVRDAMLSLCEEIDSEKAAGRILASPSVSCPPAVPILICGEVIDEDAVSAFKYYGIDKIYVVK